MRRNVLNYFIFFSTTFYADFYNKTLVSDQGAETLKVVEVFPYAFISL